MKKSITRKKEIKILGLPIYTILDGKRIGKIRDAVVSNAQKKVSALLIEEEWYKGPSIILFDSVQSMNKDAVMIQSEEEVVSLAKDEGTEELIKEDIRILGKTVITVDGKFKGELLNFSIDPQTGVVTSCEVKDTSNSGSIEVVPGADIVTFGKDVLVVSGESEIKVAIIKEVTRRRILGEKSFRAEAPRPTITQPEKKPLPTEMLEPEVKEVKEKERIEARAKLSSQETAKAEEEGLKEDLRAALEKDLDRTLLGKRAVKDIFGDDGSLIIKADEAVTDETIEKAKEANRHFALSFFVKERA